MLPEIRMALFVEAIGRYRSGELSCLEAAEVWACRSGIFVVFVIVMRLMARRGSLTGVWAGLITGNAGGPDCLGA